MQLYDVLPLHSQWKSPDTRVKNPQYREKRNLSLTISKSCNRKNEGNQESFCTKKFQQNHEKFVQGVKNAQYRVSRASR